ncbi:MAG: NAD(P)H-binding protein [Devosia sp.]|nr:NAD(P)H-binding protein [Devosia sp.]
MSKFLDSTLAVTGASGHLGRRTVELLLEAGAKRVVAVTRDPARLADLKQRGVDVRAGSFDDAPSLPAAFAGVDRLLIVSTDGLAEPGFRTRQHVRAIEAALQAGVGHLVYTSLTSPYPDPASLVADSHFWTEVRLVTSDIGWSILRNNQYADYLIPGAQHAIASGTLFHAAGTGRRAYVTREDCAAAAAHALLGAEGQRIFDVGGPEALSGDDLAAIYTRLSGKPVEAIAVSGDAYRGGLLKSGIPAPMADILTRFDTDAARGYLGIVGNGVETLTGRSPQSVESFLTGNRAALAA